MRPSERELQRNSRSRPGLLHVLRKRQLPRLAELEKRANGVASPSGVDFRFRSASLRMGAAEVGELCNDCALVFGQQTGSNWLPAAATPSCALERLALAIFEQHTAGVAFDRARSGAEWWVQVREGGSGKQDSRGRRPVAARRSLAFAAPMHACVCSCLCSCCVPVVCCVCARVCVQPL